MLVDLLLSKPWSWQQCPTITPHHAETNCHGLRAAGRRGQGRGGGGTVLAAGALMDPGRRPRRGPSVLLPPRLSIREQDDTESGWQRLLGRPDQQVG